MKATTSAQRAISIRNPARIRPAATIELALHAGDPDFMASLARGLWVLRSFAEHPRGMTTSQISIRTGISRASVRRCLATLTKLGYAFQDGLAFRLTPKVLNFSHAYLSSASLANLAQPFLDHVRDRLHESCSIGVLEGGELVYVARAETQRFISISLRVGSRLPAYCTSMGRMLLAQLPPEGLETYLARTSLVARTGRTVTSPRQLQERLDTIVRIGYAIVDQELELGLRSIAVPIRDRANAVVAALNVGVPSARVPLRELTARFLPILQAAAYELGAAYDAVSVGIRAPLK
jgi:IclR family transcriptional regulator, pca regulon regulatory protein